MGAVTGEAGEGEAGGRHEEVRVRYAAVEAEGGRGKGGGMGGAQGHGAAGRPSQPAECDRDGASVVGDILEALEEEVEETGRMAMAGGQRQPAAVNVLAAAISSILPEV